VALVTGASSGLGAHFAMTLAAAGARVIAAARRQEELARVVGLIKSTGGSASAIHLDVTDTDSIKALDNVLDDIDIVVNNAGIARSGFALEQSAVDWDTVIDTNLKGMFFVAQVSALALRAKNRRGSIINIASILGIRQASSVAPYAISKAGVIQMTKTLALEFARFDIRVNALAPGYLATDLNSAFIRTHAGQELVRRIPQRRLGKLQDLDGPLLLLASDASSYMTGAVIPVDGGHLVSSL
jgi:NAD(P)-dependent dehydrogenase (short-subunit alcohol dehydrogenase family)